MAKPFTFNQWYSIVSFIDSKFPKEPMTDERRFVEELYWQLHEMFLSKEMTPQKRVAPAVNISYRRTILKFLRSDPPAPAELLEQTKQMLEGLDLAAKKVPIKRDVPRNRHAQSLVRTLTHQIATQSTLCVELEVSPASMSNFIKGHRKSLSEEQYQKLSALTDTEVRRLRKLARELSIPDPAQALYVTALATYLAHLADSVEPSQPINLAPLG